jgi:hypothetical protein
LGVAALITMAGATSAFGADHRTPFKVIDDPAATAVLQGDVPSEALTLPDGWISQRVLRLPSGCGAGAQGNGDFINGLTGAGFSGQSISAAASPTFMRADNFRVAGTGAQTITNVKWSGLVTQGTSPGIVAITPAQLSTLQFTIAIYNDNNGTPNTATPLFTTNVVPTVTTNATDTMPSGNASGTLTFSVLDFDAAVPNWAVTGSTNYWIEIRPIAGSSAAGQPLASRTYFWRSSNQGDGFHLRRTATNIVWDATRVVNGDLAFCIAGTVNADSSPLALVSQADGVSFGPNGVGSPLACYPSNACQTYDGTGTAFASHSAGTGFKAADNFTINANATITNLCWEGVYVLGTGDTWANSWQIRIMPDRGGAASGVPNEDSPIATINITGGAGPNGATVTEGTINPFPNIFGESATQKPRAWSMSFGTAPINLTPGCYWIEIRSTDTNTPFFLSVKDNARATTIADDFYQQTGSAAEAYRIGTQTTGGDLVWCFNSIGVVRSTTCAPAAPAPNRTCETAQTLTINGPIVGNNNVTVIPLAEPFFPTCAFDTINSNGNYYTFIGNGQDVTVSTCNAGTDYDTIIHVYCSQNAGSTLATQCDGPFVCVGANDDDTTPCASNALASRVVVPTVNGNRYFVYVMGTEATSSVVQRGVAFISATSTTNSTAPVACSALSACRIDIPAGAIDEGVGCGETDSDCTTAPVLAFNQWATGTVSSDGDTRDQDIWRMPDAISAVSGGQWFTVEFRAEFPANFVIFRSACVAGGLTNGIGNNQLQCQSGDTLNYFVPAGGFHVLIRPSGFQSPQCDPAGRGNRYVFRVRPANVGVCCIASTACSVTIAGGAARLASDPNDCVGLNGVYLGDGTTCDANDPNLLLPCDINGAPQGTTTGSCCDGYANCTVTVSTSCPSGSTFAANGVCDPDPCATVSVQRCCQPSGVCIVIPSAQCTSGGGTPAAGTTCFPNACPQAPSGVCCGNTGVCAVTIQVDCPTDVTGITWSVGGSCSPNPCDQPRACCTGATCTVVTQTICTSGGGTAQGANSVCVPDPCSAPATSTCCRGTTCALTSSGDCTAPAGVGISFLGASTSCNAGGSNTTPCCFADFNKDGTRNIDDIFIYLNAWFGTASNPFTKIGGNGVATANIDDLFIFLNVWFAGGCG